MVKSKKQGVVDLTSLAEDIIKLGIITSVEQQEDKEVNITFDKSQDQFSLKIPRGMARELKIDPKKDKFKFTFHLDKKSNLSLKGELIRNGKT